MVNFLRRFFPYRADSFEEFLNFTRKIDCSNITVELTREFIKRCRRKNIGEINYILTITAVSSNGGKVFYSQKTLVIFGQTEEGEDRNYKISSLLTAEFRFKELAKKFPGVSIDFIGPDGVMTTFMCKKLHRDARKYGVL